MKSIESGKGRELLMAVPIIISTLLGEPIKAEAQTLNEKQFSKLIGNFRIQESPVVPGITNDDFTKISGVIIDPRSISIPTQNGRLMFDVAGATLSFAPLVGSNLKESAFLLGLGKQIDFKIDDNTLLGKMMGKDYKLYISFDSKLDPNAQTGRFFIPEAVYLRFTTKLN